MKWVDKEKPLFKVCSKLVSTVNTEVSYVFALLACFEKQIVGI